MSFARVLIRSIDIMSDTSIPHPKIVTQNEWLVARQAHLAREKELTRQFDRLRAERRRLPMVKIEKNYIFDGPNGKRTLRDLFEGRRQLIVYHFMFDPQWEKGCPGCTHHVDALGNLSPLNERNTTFAMVSRAPLSKLDAYKALRGWSFPWYSSFDSDFNYDFHVTLDEGVAPREYNYRSAAELDLKYGGDSFQGEQPGLSVFFRLDDDLFHTYSTYARGTESLSDAYSHLDTTPYGRQEDFEDSPPGWPQKKTYG
jgi:predicted dithiol-disulfide oxidoreductase (DUF899 family)